MACFLRKAAAVCLSTVLAVLLFRGTEARASSPITAGAFASYPVSVRGAGMGGAYAALAERNGAPYHNPAWMGFADQRSVGVSYADLSSLGLVRNIYLDYVQPDKGYGASGLYWNWRGTEVEGSGGIGKLGYAENTLCYALGKRIGRYVAVGAAVKGYFITTDIQDMGGKGAGLDLAFYAAPDPFSTVAVVVRNAISRVAWDTGLKDNLPRELEIGGSYLVLDQLVIIAELRFERSHYSAFTVGGEYTLMPEMFFARGGLTHRFDRTSPSFGLGFRHQAFRVDYAAEIDSGNSGLGTTHRIGMSLDF